MDESNLNKGYTLVNILETNNTYGNFVLTATYREENSSEMMEVGSAIISKRNYPNGISISTEKDSYNNKLKNELTVNYSPNEINDVTLVGRGIFNVSW
jgi:hypothetical protein